MYTGVVYDLIIYIFFYLSNLSNLHVIAKDQRQDACLFFSLILPPMAFQIQMCLELNSLNKLLGKSDR